METIYFSLHSLFKLLPALLDPGDAIRSRDGLSEVEGGASQSSGGYRLVNQR